MKILLLLLAAVLASNLLVPAAVATTPLQVTMLMDFSEKGAEACQLQQQWEILRTDAGDKLDVQYEHVSLQRSLELVQQEGYCSLNKRKTPQREQHLLFSRYPLNIGASLKMIHPASKPLPASRRSAIRCAARDLTCPADQDS